MPKQSKIQKIQTAKKTKYREKIRKILIVGLSLVLSKKCILIIQVQRGLYFTVFFQIQRANICIGMHSFELLRKSRVDSASLKRTENFQPEKPFLHILSPKYLFLILLPFHSFQSQSIITEFHMCTTMPQHENCNSYYENFERSERSQPCGVCNALGLRVLGVSHRCKDTGKVIIPHHVC
jgi:hypothetical protein